jgi:hypothetical protein
MRKHPGPTQWLPQSIRPRSGLITESRDGAFRQAHVAHNAPPFTPLQPDDRVGGASIVYGARRQRHRFATKAIAGSGASRRDCISEHSSSPPAPTPDERFATPQSRGQRYCLRRRAAASGPISMATGPSPASVVVGASWSQRRQSRNARIRGRARSASAERRRRTRVWRAAGGPASARLSPASW